MPIAAPKLCSYPGCKCVSEPGTCRCVQHPYPKREWKPHYERFGEYGARWRKLRKVALVRDNYLCVPCMAEGRITPAQEVDHIKPKSAGGRDNIDNLQSICKACHAKKSQQEAAQGRSGRGD